MEAVSSGDKVTLVGFGSFESRHRKAREGRNPKTGEKNGNSRYQCSCVFCG